MPHSKCSGEWGLVMYKSQLVDAVSEKLWKVSKKDIEKIVDTLFDCITEAMIGGERIEIRGFGVFAPRTRHAKEGRNPKTGEKIHVPRKRVPFFTAGKELRERVNAGRRH
jgi:integration host factor subunit beta